MTLKHETVAEAEMRKVVGMYAGMGCVVSVQTIEDAPKLDTIGTLERHWRERGWIMDDATHLRTTEGRA